jgi:hypothetical protein
MTDKQKEAQRKREERQRKADRWLAANAVQQHDTKDRRRAIVVIVDDGLGSPAACSLLDYMFWRRTLWDSYAFLIPATPDGRSEDIEAKADELLNPQDVIRCRPAGDDDPLGFTRKDQRGPRDVTVRANFEFWTPFKGWHSWFREFSLSEKGDNVVIFSNLPDSDDSFRKVVEILAPCRPRIVGTVLPEWAKKLGVTLFDPKDSFETEEERMQDADSE